ncbi:MAG: hypothetical protein AABZ61_09855, partial [Bacteroidota bacterium]
SNDVFVRSSSEDFKAETKKKEQRCDSHAHHCSKPHAAKFVISANIFPMLALYELNRKGRE